MLKLIWIVAQDVDHPYDKKHPHTKADITDRKKTVIEHLFIEHLSEIEAEYGLGHQACIGGTLNKIVESMSMKVDGVLVTQCKESQLTKGLSADILKKFMPLALWHIQQDETVKTIGKKTKEEYFKSFLSQIGQFDVKKIMDDHSLLPANISTLLGAVKAWFKNHSDKAMSR